MRKSINTFKWYDRPWAALIFFTRLPWWRIHQPPKDCYRSVVEYWPLTGWLTAICTATILYFGTLLFPYSVSVILALSVRLLLTGALHEDGLGDFIDGFGGGGTDRQRILDIMKDSHIGTYGVLGLVVYEALLAAALISMPPFVAAIAILAADPFSKMVAGQIVIMMPYARHEEDAKSEIIYRPINIRAGIGLAVQGLLPIVPLFYFIGDALRWELVVFVPCIVMYILYLLIWRRLRGYTGDCCGALFLLIELSFYLNILAQTNGKILPNLLF